MFSIKRRVSKGKDLPETSLEARMWRFNGGKEKKGTRWECGCVWPCKHKMGEGSLAECLSVRVLHVKMLTLPFNLKVGRTFGPRANWNFYENKISD